MPRKRPTAEQFIRKLREAEVELTKDCFEAGHQRSGKQPHLQQPLPSVLSERVRSTRVRAHHGGGLVAGVVHNPVDRRTTVGRRSDESGSE